MVADRPDMICTDLVCHPKGKVVSEVSDNTSQEDTEFYHLNKYVIPGVIIPIVVFGVVGNGAVIHVIRSARKLRTLTNLLIVNLSVVGAIYLLIWGCFIVFHHALPTWPFGGVTCKLANYFRYVTSYMTIYTLVLIAVVRWLSVTAGAQERFPNLLRNRNILLCLAGLWLLFLCANIPVFWIIGESVDASHNVSSGLILYCDVLGSKLEDGKALNVCAFVFGYILPVSLIIGFYFATIRFIRMRSNSVSLGTKNVDQARSRARHVTEVFIFLVGTFAVCQLPLHVHLILNMYGAIDAASVTSLKLLTTWYVLQFLNHALNPVIYSVSSSLFRHSVMEVFCCRSHSDPTAQI